MKTFINYLKSKAKTSEPTLASKACQVEPQTPTSEQIRERAYLLWEESGRPEGDGTEFWALAELQLCVDKI